MWFGLDIIVIYYLCNTRVVTLQQNTTVLLLCWMKVRTKL